MFGGIWSEFGIDTTVGPEPTRIVVELERLYYPDWAKDAWGSEQGFGPLTDEQARVMTLSMFHSLIFAPAATFDAAGEMLSSEESGFLQVDNIYFL